MNLWRIPIDEESGAALGEPEPLTRGVAGSSGSLSISQDGRQIAYVSSTSTRNFQNLSFDPVAGAIVGNPVWVTRGSSSVAYPNLSPDAEWLAHTTGRPQEDLYLIPADGTSGLRQLTDDLYKDRMPRWSPDGKRIAFYSDRSGSYEIWTIRPDGSGLTQLTETPGHSVIYPVWSPDGGRMVYTCFTERVAFIFEPDSPWAEQSPERLPPIDDQGTWLAVLSWSPDGKQLAGVSRSPTRGSGAIVTYDLDTSEYRTLTDFGASPVWLSDSRRLLFVDQENLLLLDSQSGEYRVLQSFAPHRPGYEGVQVGVSRDDRLIYLIVITSAADIWMLTLN